MHEYVREIRKWYKEFDELDEKIRVAKKECLILNIMIGVSIMTLISFVGWIVIEVI